MAQVYMPHLHQIEFPTAPINHAPATLGFGFGLSAPGPFSPSQSGSVTPSPLSPFGNAMNQASGSSNHGSALGKRSRSIELDDGENAMERSPTPTERPVRRLPHGPHGGKKWKSDHEHGLSTDSNSNDCDIGVLLARVDPEQHREIIVKLLQKHPNLKSDIIDAIPRPNLDLALRELSAAAKKLEEEAIPYSAPTTRSSSPPSHRAPTSRRSLFDWADSTEDFNLNRPLSHGQSSTGISQNMMNRVERAVPIFRNSCDALLPFFSFRSQAHKDPPSLEEAFQFLAALTEHILNRHPVVQTVLLRDMMQPLSTEWATWLNRVDEQWNCLHNLFGASMNGPKWLHTLDSLVDRAQSKNSGLEGMLVMLRDNFVQRVGHHAGRTPPFSGIMHR